MNSFFMVNDLRNKFYLYDVELWERLSIISGYPG